MDQKKFTNIPDFLCIGFFCHDVHKDDYILGGTASYSSLIANTMMDGQVAVLTSVGADFKFWKKFQDATIEVCNKIAAKTTIFENIYHQGKRTQYIYNRSETLTAADLPAAWKQTKLVKLCLIADEVDLSLLDQFPDALIAATVQGWLRQWDDKGKVSPKVLDWKLLEKVDIVLMSEDDIFGFEDILPKIIESVQIVVVTRGDQGATVYYQNKAVTFPVFPIKEIDPTGAGDIFAVSFLVKYIETKDLTLATTYAHVAASYVVEGVGVHLPSMSAIEARWIEYQEKFPHFFTQKNAAL